MELNSPITMELCVCPKKDIKRRRLLPKLLAVNIATASLVDCSCYFAGVKFEIFLVGSLT